MQINELFAKNFILGSSEPLMCVIIQPQTKYVISLVYRYLNSGIYVSKFLYQMHLQKVVFLINLRYGTNSKQTEQYCLLFRLLLSIIIVTIIIIMIIIILIYKEMIFYSPPVATFRGHHSRFYNFYIIFSCFFHVLLF